MNHLALRGCAITVGLLMGAAAAPPSAYAIQAATTIACGDTAGLITAITNLNGPGGTIQLAENCTYTFTDVAAPDDALPPISGKITIKGEDSGIVRSSSVNKPFRLFELLPTGDLTLQGIEVSGGDLPGGKGGGVLVPSGGKLTLDESAVAHNKSEGGGGIWNEGTVALHRSSVSDNVADAGAGIFATNHSTITAKHSKFDGNQADSTGAAIFNASGTLSVEDSVLDHNTALNGYGGAVFNTDKATLTDSELSDNFAGRDGGGLYNTSGSTLEITGGLIADNRAGLDGGGLNNLGDATLTKVKIKANSAGRVGGGIHNQKSTGPSTLTLRHSTVAGNTAAVNGGGILNDYGAAVTLDESRIVDNAPNNCSPLGIPGCAS